MISLILALFVDISEYSVSTLSFVSDAFLADSFADLVQSADTGSLPALHQHVLFHKPGQLTLLSEHGQECADELIVVVCPPTVINLQYTDPS